ncbi:reelin domain-containing protein 1 [Antechinus flavipes]|uniref:reelin domain-containing protein 1 n=1 Tax=Antechinus flavipes TaxID=38775 RepID=UPI0022357799|nr:reelin domain-containing protein 1 [Antechinus flavipes]
MKIQEAIIGWAYSAFCMISHTEAFSHGASLVACVDMKPRHIRAQLQNPRSSYITIYTNVSSYSPGDKIPVTVRSRGDFMGFLLQARRVSDDQIAGTFVSIPSGSKLMSCFEGANTVTHLDKSPKRNLSFVWKAPQQPTGDIKFFLSVVQSYFIYWERIESTIVSQQTQNRTLSDGNVEPAASLRKPNGLEVTTTVPSIPLAQHTQPVAFAVVSLAGTSVTDSLEPALVTTETPGHEEHLLNPSPLGDMAAGASGSDRRRQFDQYGPHPGRDQTSEPSLAVPVLENFPFQDDGSSHNPPNRYWATTKWGSKAGLEPKEIKWALIGFETGRNHRNRVWTRGDSDSGPAQPCLHCEEGRQARENVGGSFQGWDGELTGPFAFTFLFLAGLLLKERPEAFRLSQTGPPAASLTAHLSSSRPVMGAPAEARHGGVPPNSSVNAKASAALKRSALRLSGLPQAKSEPHGGAGEDSTGPARPAEAGLEPGGPVSPPGPGLLSAQLGALLCLSATLGMALAAGLRRLRAQCCRRGTQVSLREPDIPAERDGGETIRFQKIRENSVVLVQAEYNWIAPNGGAQRAAV